MKKFKKILQWTMFILVCVLCLGLYWTGEHEVLTDMAASIIIMGAWALVIFGEVRFGG